MSHPAESANQLQNKYAGRIPGLEVWYADGDYHATAPDMGLLNSNCLDIIENALEQLLEDKGAEGKLQLIEKALIDYHKKLDARDESFGSDDWGLALACFASCVERVLGMPWVQGKPDYRKSDGPTPEVEVRVIIADLEKRIAWLEEHTHDPQDE